MSKFATPVIVTSAVLFASNSCFAREQAQKVEVSSLKNPLDVSYRRMQSGVDLFEKKKAELAPQSSLRFKLISFQKQEDTELTLKLVYENESKPIPIRADSTFELPVDPRALAEDASLRPNKRLGALVWRADIRTPGLPKSTRRLGDLRLECEVGHAADLVAYSTLALFKHIFGDQCYKGAQYLLFADKAIWRVRLRYGERVEELSNYYLYLQFTVKSNEYARYNHRNLIDRTYSVPYADFSWPNDTLVELIYMDDEE